MSLQIKNQKTEILIVLYDVDNLITASEPKEDIVQYNLEGDFLTEEDDIISRFKTGSRDKRTVPHTSSSERNTF